MSCHLRYFDVKGYFNSLGYTNNMGFDVARGLIDSNPISDDDRQRLEEAVKLSDEDSRSGKLAGIVQLIQTVEALQDKYGASHEHKHPTPEVVKAMCRRTDLIQRYDLESIAKKLGYHSHDGHGHHHHHGNGARGKNGKSEE